MLRRPRSRGTSARRRSCTLEAIFAARAPEARRDPRRARRAFNPPPIRGLGSTGGFELQVEDIAGGSLRELATRDQALIDEASSTPELRSLVHHASAPNVPQYAIDIDRTKAKALGPHATDVFDTLQTYLGGYYVNDFDRFGRVVPRHRAGRRRVALAARGLARLYARNATGEMVPLGDARGA